MPSIMRCPKMVMRGAASLLMDRWLGETHFMTVTGGDGLSLVTIYLNFAMKVVGMRKTMRVSDREEVTSDV
jgi:hypothetical protein